MDFIGTGWQVGDWIGLFQDRAVLRCSDVPLQAGNFLTSSETNSFLRISPLDGAASTALFKK
jgi:hypothetical protein